MKNRTSYLILTAINLFALFSWLIPEKYNLVYFILQNLFIGSITSLFLIYLRVSVRELPLKSYAFTSVGIQVAALIHNILMYGSYTNYVFTVSVSATILLFTALALYERHKFYYVSDEYTDKSRLYYVTRLPRNNMEYFGYICSFFTGGSIGFLVNDEVYKYSRGSKKFEVHNLSELRPGYRLVRGKPHTADLISKLKGNVGTVWTWIACCTVLFWVV